MRVREAKDFLVKQTEEQALLEELPLSSLEKRMMYFTEGKDAVEDPTTLNDEFEAQYDTSKFEKKISRLMSRAYKRLKKEDPEGVIQWNKAIHTLRQGDHYILVLWGHPLSHGSSSEWRIILVVALPAIFFWLFLFLFSPGRSGQPPFLRRLPLPSPVTVRIMQALFLALFIAAIFFPKIFEPVSKLFGQSLDWLMGVGKKEADTEK